DTRTTHNTIGKFEVLSLVASERSRARTPGRAGVVAASKVPRGPWELTDWQNWQSDAIELGLGRFGLSPGLDAGQDDGDEPPKLTGEERLFKEIQMQEELLNALPDAISDILPKKRQMEKGVARVLPKERLHDILRRSEHEKKLGQLQFKYLMLNVSDELARSCARDIRESGLGIGKCPLCRESLDGKTKAEQKAQEMALAKRGVIWAQSQVGQYMIVGVRGFEGQVQTRLDWINKAAAQNFPPALYDLSIFHRSGIAFVLEKSEEKANELLLEAANLGYAKANSDLSKVFKFGFGGFEEDLGEAYSRASVAFAIDRSNEDAAKMLAIMFHENASEYSPYLACYYLNIAANEETSGDSCFLYSQALIEMNSHLHNCLNLIGFNATPAAFFWARKSCDMGFDCGREMLKKWEGERQSFCANCGKNAQSGEKYKQCSNCRAQWYVSKECQVEAWNAGHKKDCKRARILMFEDYLNAELEVLPGDLLRYVIWRHLDVRPEGSNTSLNGFVALVCFFRTS
ncbi:hypothetical protein THAOC_17496, partial [Thalassiosira oceanica]